MASTSYSRWDDSLSPPASLEAAAQAYNPPWHPQRREKLRLPRLPACVLPSSLRCYAHRTMLLHMKPSKEKEGLIHHGLENG